MRNQDRYDVFILAVDLIESKGFNAEIHEGYSGRGMYGQTVSALASDAPPLVVGAAVCAAIISVLECSPEQAVDITPQRQDTLGLSQIYY